MIRRVDRYELLEQIGSGGMAVVYRGRDTALDREVAVKLLHPHLAARAESRARFSREARAVARLSHPNIVEIYDYAGEAAVESYLVTEFVHGRTLRAFADEEGVGFPEVGALLVRALADALVHAHAAGVIHRDLKPENVLLLEGSGRRAVKLVDFGIARLLASDEKMTMTGALVGSPNHMAPEIIEGRAADARSDLFSLGTILYWLATGALPFAAPNPTATLRRVIEGDQADPRRLSRLVSDELAGVIARALQTDPARRTASAAELRADLDAALAASGISDAAEELQDFLRDPPAYKAALRGRLVASALERADTVLRARETARGMKLLDRVLALDPDNAGVAARLRRVAVAARWRSLGRRAAAGCLVAGAVLALGWSVLATRPERPAIEAPHAPASLPALAPGAPAPGSPAGVGAGAVPAPPRPETARPTAAAEPARAGAPRGSSGTRQARADRGAVPHDAPPGAAMPSTPSRSDPRSAERLASPGRPLVVQVHVRPYAQRALLDGVEVAQGEQRVAFSLAPGVPHRIEVEHACCFPFVREFAAGEPMPQPLELKVPLRPRPARLRVEADPATRVYVDGRLAGTAAESQRGGLEVPVPPTGDSPYEAAAELTLEQDGGVPLRATVRLRAGAEVTFAAPSVPRASSAAAAPPQGPATVPGAAR